MMAKLVILHDVTVKCHVWSANFKAKVCAKRAPGAFFPGCCAAGCSFFGRQMNPGVPWRSRNGMNRNWNSNPNSNILEKKI